jgi:hypothetical protein
MGSPIARTRIIDFMTYGAVLECAMYARLLVVAALLAAFAYGFAELVRKTDTVGEVPPAESQE